MCGAQFASVIKDQMISKNTTSGQGRRGKTAWRDDLGKNSQAELFAPFQNWIAKNHHHVYTCKNTSFSGKRHQKSAQYIHMSLRHLKVWIEYKCLRHWVLYRETSVSRRITTFGISKTIVSFNNAALHLQFSCRYQSRFLVLRKCFCFSVSMQVFLSIAVAGFSFFPKTSLFALTKTTEDSCME